MQRRTRQRAVIRDAFQSLGRPLSPSEAYQAACGRMPGIGIATVYRAIRELVSEGWLRVVVTPGVGDRYELAGKPHHHHFLCRGCDSLWEIDACVDGVAELTPLGFQTDSHEITLYGLCEGCRSS